MRYFRRIIPPLMLIACILVAFLISGAADTKKIGWFETALNDLKTFHYKAMDDLEEVSELLAEDKESEAAPYVEGCCKNIKKAIETCEDIHARLLMKAASSYGIVARDRKEGIKYLERLLSFYPDQELATPAKSFLSIWREKEKKKESLSDEKN